MDPLKSEVTSSLVGLKSSMKTLTGKIEDWILTTQGEEERRVRIRALNTIIGLHGDRLPAHQGA